MLLMERPFTDWMQGGKVMKRIRDCSIMPALFVIILLTALFLSSGQGEASPPQIDISAEDLQMLQTQAAQGHTEAQTTLGHLYNNGRGVPQDYVKAAQWYEKAAALGDMKAQHHLGALYENGRGVPKDYPKAHLWQEKAAVQGYVLAQYNLGTMYEDGRGVPQDYTKALQWYEKAAAQGDAGAQFQLGGLYFGAKGVPRDHVRTYMWWNLASAHSAGDLQKMSTDLRDKVARRMTPSQIAEAQRLAQQCEARQFKGC
jgi:TPR repeat protein